MSEPFLFDDFFVPADDAGVERIISVGGRDVPVYVKRGLSLGDREAAKAVATTTKANPQTGRLEFAGFDEGRFQIELLYRCLVSWPFTYPGGMAVPITRANIAAMKSRAADAMSGLVTELVGDEEAKKEALAPFVSPSGEASSPEAPADPTSQPSPSVSA